MSENAQKILNNIATNNKLGATKTVADSIREKLTYALEIRKVGLTSQIFNKVEETKNDN